MPLNGGADGTLAPFSYIFSEVEGDGSGEQAENRP